MERFKHEENLGVAIALLEPLLKTTNAGKNVAALMLEGEAVKIIFAGGNTARVPIFGESSIQAIIDVCRALQ